MKKLPLLMIMALSIGCTGIKEKKTVGSEANLPDPLDKTSLIILGTVQDGGSPHIGCKKDCCKGLFKNPDQTRKVASLGLIDPQNRKTFLIDATPDITMQMKMLKMYSDDENEVPDGILLTHAHIGHYTGLMYLGREAMDAKGIPVYAMPLMAAFLQNNGPWSQLVNNQNINLMALENEREAILTPNLAVTPFEVPHRNEYAETVGFRITGPSKSALFIPDINKWEKWERDIMEEIRNVDYAFIDGTFFDAAEVNYRDISEIPHPFIVESMALFKDLPEAERGKIHFIHLNHTNPALREDSDQTRRILDSGFRVARIYDVFDL